MSVNRNFYTTLNELMKRASKGTISAVVDYASFVDAGKVLSAMSINDLVNDFCNPLMNKVQQTIERNPSYMGALVDMYKGKLNYGVLETIMSNFYDMSQSVFDGNSLTNGTTYTDQFKVNMLDKSKVLYHSKSDSWDFTLTIRDTDLKAAFTSVEKMDSFIRMLFTSASNSMEFAKENARLGTFDAMLKRCSGETENSTDETKGAQNYNLLAIYNAKFGTTLTTANCLYNDSFVRFCVSTIKDISKMMEKPSTKFSSKGGDDFATFTPADYRKVKIASLFEKAISVSLIDAYNRADALLGMDYEALAYWQNEADRLRVTTNTAEGSTTTYSKSIIACVYDDRAIGEMVQLEDVESTRNTKYRYTNYHYLTNYMYFENPYANAVIFTIG